MPRPSPAVRRTVAASLPRVLCLQLRRGFWSHHGHVKVAGAVSFPLRLRLTPSLVPQLGAARPLQGEAEPATAYLLQAVVVHVGALAGGGHYTVFRRLGPAAPGSCWAKASDESVQAASEEEVLCAEASMLLYERLQ